MMKLLPSTIVLMFLLISFSFLQTTVMAGSDFCNSKCATRCSKASFQDRCLKYCGICCKDCNCVPSGTYGHKDECPCYRDKKAASGKDKCP